jgi:hypothetical protein
MYQQRVRPQLDLRRGGDPANNGEEKGRKAAKTLDNTKRWGSEDSEDDGLRMIISRTDQYCLTRSQKKANDNDSGLIKLATRRRLDFLGRMQQFDPKSEI